MSSRRAGVSSFLLAMWFGLIAADRVDLAGGAAPFHLTPFLVLTPIVAVAELARRWRQRSRLMISGSIVVYTALAGLLLALGLTSSILSLRMETSAPRVVLLVADVIGALTIALLAADRPDLLKTLAAGAIAILPVFIIADVQAARWLIGRGPELWRLGTLTVHFDELQTLGLVPRLPGLVGDANRTGYLLAVYWTVISRGERRPARRRIALGVVGLLLLLTFSRSALLAIATAIVVEFMTRSRPPTAKIAAVAMALLTVGTGMVIASPKLQNVFLSAGAQAAKRASPNESSAKSHVQLIERGIEEGSSSVPNGLIGLGYGNAYLVLQDYFPGNRYGNFHSLYITMFAEMGVIAFIVIIILMFTPVFLGGPWRPLAAAAMAFNIFYQTGTEPIFWFVLSMAWLTLAVRDEEKEPVAHVTPDAHPVTA